MTQRVHRICSICEAGCGLEVELATTPDADARVVSIRANDADVFSEGHVCAKGIALKQLDADPDRLRQPLIRDGGELRPASWEEAFAFIADRLQWVRATHGPQAVAAYIGNPTAHNIGLSMGLGAFVRNMGSTHVYSAGSVDQLPKQLASELMFGNDMAIPVPDIQHTDCLVVIGANPAVSNGSLWMVPKIRDKLRALHARGGRLVVIDPRRTETARLADEHLFIQPGTDVYLLLVLIKQLLALGREMPARYQIRGWSELKQTVQGIDLAQVSTRTGIPEAQLQALASTLNRATSPVLYGRVGTTVQKHGTLVSFLIEVVNLLTGSLDRQGGALFPEQAYAAAQRPSGGLQYARYQSRVSGYPEVLGQLPVAALAEEIETPGQGQVRALVCIAGNPVISNPDSDRLQRALQTLDLLVCVDIYVNETSGLADVILPGTSIFEDSHYDSFLGSMGWRNVARYSPPVFAPTQPREWDIGLTLGFINQHGEVPDDRQLRAYEDEVVAGAVSAYCQDQQNPLFGRDVQEILGAIEPEAGVERLLDLGVRAGKWGDHFGRREGLTLQTLIDTPNGVDLGEVRGGRLAEVVQTPDGCIDLAPSVIMQALQALADDAEAPGLQLVGRRSVNTNNSWLHNLAALNQVRQVCVLEIHPADAKRLEIRDGEQVEVRSAVAAVSVPAKVTEAVAPGVVCLPHGFSESTDILPGQSKGANYNRLVSASAIDGPSATVALNGVPVEVMRRASAQTTG